MDIMEEFGLAKQRIIKRRIMEAQVQQGGGGEVRRVHIIYFLSRKGRVEHPHLIRVHHLSRNGVHLRDVKRWLSELRGKDMPESFAWSYKRKYKAGYVWQDLLDEDLITPISDNEYVLKGSEILSATFNNDKCSFGEKQAPIQNKSAPDEVLEEAKEEKTSSYEETRKDPESPVDVSAKTSFEIEQESPRFGSETSSVTDDSTRPEKDKRRSTTKQDEEQNGQRDKKGNNSDPGTQSNNKEGDNVNSSSSTSIKKASPPTPNSSIGKSSSNSGGAIGKSSSNSGGASHMFRNWITCGAVDTNESAVMMINRRHKTSLGVFSNKENSKKNYKGVIFKGEKLGGSERMAANSWLLEQHHDARGRKSMDERMGSKKSNNDESNEGKTVSAAYKPIKPQCKLCGRKFKPEKMHAHLKSCREVKAMAKCGNACPRPSEKTPLRREDDEGRQDSASSFYLTNK